MGLIFAEPPLAGASDEPHVTQLESLSQRAEQGDAEAMFRLAQAYAKGTGVDKDMQRAGKYYLEAAELGHAQAQLKLGTLKYLEAGGPDATQSAHWWLQAARQGLPEAQYRLAILYLKQQEPNPLDAQAWMSLAARSGHAPAIKAEALLSEEIEPVSPARLAERMRQLMSSGNAAAVSVLRPAPVPSSDGDAASLPPSSTEPEVSTADNPEPVADMNSGIQSEPEPVATVEPSPEPIPEVEQEPMPAASQEPEAPVASEPASEPESEPTSEPKVEPGLTEVSEPAAESKVQAQDQPELQRSLATPKSDTSEPVQQDITLPSPFSVQMASVLEENAAQALALRLVRKHESVLDGHSVEVKHLRGAYKILATGFADRGAAIELCEQLKARQQGCFVVKR